jgi:hypothetical protein
MTCYGDNIYLLEVADDGWCAGWYFSDETEELHGPFESLKEALVYQGTI